jgi:hypothetical protein
MNQIPLLWKLSVRGYGTILQKYFVLLHPQTFKIEIFIEG